MKILFQSAVVFGRFFIFSRISVLAFPFCLGLTLVDFVGLDMTCTVVRMR